MFAHPPVVTLHPLEVMPRSLRIYCSYNTHELHHASTNIVLIPVYIVLDMIFMTDRMYVWTFHVNC